MNVLNLVHRNITRLFEEAGIDFYDVPELNVSLPFARLANIDLSVDNFRNFETYTINQEIHLWSDYEGKKEINELYFTIRNYVNKNFKFEDGDNFELVGFKLDDVFEINDMEGLKQGILYFNIMIDVEVV